MHALWILPILAAWNGATLPQRLDILFVRSHGAKRIKSTKVGIFNLAVGLMSTGLSFGCTDFQTVNGCSVCSRFVQAHERAQAGKCPNTIQATMGHLVTGSGTLAQLKDDERCSKIRFLFPKSWGFYGQIGCVSHGPSFRCESETDHSTESIRSFWAQFRGGNMVIFLIINVLHLLWRWAHLRVITESSSLEFVGTRQCKITGCVSDSWLLLFCTRRNKLPKAPAPDLFWAVWFEKRSIIKDMLSRHLSMKGPHPPVKGSW